jgi:hypothetical protein
MIRLAIALAAPVALVACAQTPEETFGTRVAAEGGEIAALGESWTEGQRLAAEGRALIESGRDRLEEAEEIESRGRREIRRGEEMVERGLEMQREAEADYRRRRPAPGA